MKKTSSCPVTIFPGRVYTDETVAENFPCGSRRYLKHRGECDKNCQEDSKYISGMQILRDGMIRHLSFSMNLSLKDFRGLCERSSFK